MAKYSIWMDDLDAGLMDNARVGGLDASDAAFEPMRAMLTGDDWTPHLEYWKREAGWGLDFYWDAAFVNDGGDGARMRRSLSAWIERYGYTPMGR